MNKYYFFPQVPGSVILVKKLHDFESLYILYRIRNKKVSTKKEDKILQSIWEYLYKLNTCK